MKALISVIALIHGLAAFTATGQIVVEFDSLFICPIGELERDSCNVQSMPDFAEFTKDYIHLETKNVSIDYNVLSVHGEPPYILYDVEADGLGYNVVYDTRTEDIMIYKSDPESTTWIVYR